MKFKDCLRLFSVFALVFVLISPNLSAQGNFEFGFHFGHWGVNFLESIINDGINDELPDILYDIVVEENENLQQADFYLDEFSLDTGRNSWGIEIRWDIFPEAKIRPFFTFGGGVAGGKIIQDARLIASLSGELQIQGEEKETFDESVDKTLGEIENDEIADGSDAFLQTLLPFIQLNFGVKGEIAKNLYLMVESGIFNGFILRAGI